MSAKPYYCKNVTECYTTGGRPIFEGQVITKGNIRARWCFACGGLIHGTPGLYQRLYRWWHGKWGHQ